MGKRKSTKKSTSPKQSPKSKNRKSKSKAQTSSPSSDGPVDVSVPADKSSSSPSTPNAQSTVMKTDLAISSSASADKSPSSPSTPNAQSTVEKTDLAIPSGSDTPVDTDISDPTKMNSVKVAPTEPESNVAPKVIDSVPSPTISANAAPAANPATVQAVNSPAFNSWVDSVKGNGRLLKKKGTAFTLPSGEACVRIPNSVIERGRKTWEFFIIGQFYHEPPSQGTLHNIVNGIWSKQYRDIVVSKLEGNAFLFRIPNAFTRNRVLTQRLWQIEGKTMFVAKWEPGIIPVKPELSAAPIWLELRNVPYQFFYDEAIEHIAGLVGEPKCLHPSTLNKSNLDVAKVLTIIDPRKPLPEAVNAQFDTGETRRILVSSPWMPPVCSHCKEIGHSLKHCRSTPITCTLCSSCIHTLEKCPRATEGVTRSRRNQRRNRSKTPARDHRANSKGKEVVGKEWVVKTSTVVATWMA